MSNELTSFSINIQLLRKRKGMSQAQLASALGVARTTISNWEKGVAFPLFEDLINLSKQLDSTLNGLVNQVDLATTTHSNISSERFKQQSISTAPGKAEATEAPGNIIILDIRAAAGYADSSFSPQYLSGKPRMDLPDKQYRGAGLFAIQVAGDSMAPTILQGDWLVVRKLERPLEDLRQGHVHVVLGAQDGPVAKRLYLGDKGKSLVLRSDNPTYPDQEISGDGYVAIYRALRLMRDELGTQGRDLYARMDRLEREFAILKKR